MQISFQAYYTARVLEHLSENDKFIPVYASSNIKVYPFQIAAADFTLRSPYQKGVIYVMKVVWEKVTKLCLLLCRNGMKEEK